MSITTPHSSRLEIYIDVKFLFITFMGQYHRAPAAWIADRSFVLTYLKNTFPDFS